MKEGLKPSSGVRKVFMTSDIGEAKSFASGHKRGALLEIRVPHGTGLEKMSYSQMGHVGVVPPEWLRVHSTVKDNPESTGPTRIWKTLAASRAETPIHRVADAHQPKVSVAIRYAFAMGRKAIDKHGLKMALVQHSSNVKNAKTYAERATKEVASAVHLALEDVLPPTLLKALVAGGEAAASRLRTAGDVEGHPFHGNQWTEGSGEVVFHGTTAKVIDRIRMEGIKPGTDKIAFATASLESAEVYATVRAREEGAKPLVFEIHIPSKEADKMGADYGMTRPFTNYGYIISGGFKPEWIKAVHEPDANGKLKRRLLSGSTSDEVLFVVLLLKPEKRALATSLTLKFNASDPRAIKWAKQHAAELAKDISAVTEERVRAAIATALEGGSVADAQDEIAAAVGDEARAEVIARTESMMAANQGQREAWAQAADEGLLPVDAQREWIATSEACPECDALDGEVVGLDEQYPNDGGDGPPAHPNCRCTEGISGG